MTASKKSTKSAQPAPRLTPAFMVETLGVPEPAAKRFISGFLRVLRERYQEFPQHLKTQDWVALRELAHRLKSSARSVGASELGDLLEAIEMTCYEPKIDTAFLERNTPVALTMCQALLAANAGWENEHG